MDEPAADPSSLIPTPPSGLEVEGQPPPYVEPPAIQRLRTAAAAGDLHTIQDFLLDWRTKSPDERMPLDEYAFLTTYAVRNNQVSLLAFLFDQGFAMQPYFFQFATEMKLYEILQTFLDHGFDINTPIDRLTPPALVYTFDDETLMNWFLDHGANPDAPCSRDCTPLSWAVRDAPFPIIKTLFSRGGTAQNGQLLHFAAMRQSADRLEVLNFILNKGLPINNIMFQDRLDDYYMNMYSGIGTPLQSAAATGLLDSVKLLVEKGADPLIKDPSGSTALDWAEYHGHTAVVEFLRPLSVPSSEPRHDFTDAPGRHFRPGKWPE